MDVKIDENSSLENMKQEINQNIKEEAEEEKEEILKKRISSHPLYGLLLHSHLNCLKVCSGDFDSPEIMNTADDLAISKLSLHPDSSSEATSSELDQFMVLILLEAYCSTLRELKQAMEKPLIETHRFVDAVYTQLNDIVMSSSP
ncbi:protein KNATM isoform X2 [Arabidopsis lyrata subsp. lyrata]|uniref:protein KNATM isoform X2 n=1 Tax=Arabidopsis lyrata subsp. lyrata TaxID=81972 RepID=UPI000A29E5DE|nr:protein KNATM isoform X2 [Arabidopsis lyrata subsp. lyrata]|eukprot:XP_020866494.1 protein KNATM isoform X2 [Arabidopsis lyrata subsp. lyrata]